MDAMGEEVIVQPGMDVYGSDGEKVGTIQEIIGSYALVEKGFFFPKDYYVPLSAIDSADEDDNLYLTVTKDEALHQGWDSVPDLGTLPAGADTSAGLATNARARAAADLAGDERGAVAEEVIAADYVAATGPTSPGGDAVRVPVHEEEIVPVKRVVDKGTVRIEKELVTEERTITVPVTEERIRVTRQASDPSDPTGAATFEEEVIDVPIRGEEIEVRKVPRQTGAVVIEKETITHQERVGGTVRREEVRVDDRTIHPPDVEAEADR